TGCDVFDDAVGDLDFDGTSYRADWPTSTTAGTFPGSFPQTQPTSDGRSYPKLQFVTDVSASEQGCNLVNGEHCTMPPNGPGHFYPFWTEAQDPASGLGCTWQFGNVQSGLTFGGESQYGTVNPTTIGAFASDVISNPNCAGSSG